MASRFVGTFRRCLPWRKRRRLRRRRLPSVPPLTPSEALEILLLRRKGKLPSELVQQSAKVLSLPAREVVPDAQAAVVRAAIVADVLGNRSSPVLRPMTTTPAEGNRREPALRRHGRSVKSARPPKVIAGSAPGVFRADTAPAEQAMKRPRICFENVSMV